MTGMGGREVKKAAELVPTFLASLSAMMWAAMMWAVHVSAGQRKASTAASWHIQEWLVTSFGNPPPFLHELASLCRPYPILQWVCSPLHNCNNNTWRDNLCLCVVTSFFARAQAHSPILLLNNEQMYPSNHAFSQRNRIKKSSADLPDLSVEEVSLQAPLLTQLGAHVRMLGKPFHLSEGSIHQKWKMSKLGCFSPASAMTL